MMVGKVEEAITNTAIEDVVVAIYILEQSDTCINVIVKQLQYKNHYQNNISMFEKANNLFLILLQIKEAITNITIEDVVVAIYILKQSDTCINVIVNQLQYKTHYQNNISMFEKLK